MLDDSELLRYTRVPEPVPPGFARIWLDRYEEGRRDGSREAFAIVDEAGSFLGLALAPRLEHEERTAELGSSRRRHATAAPRSASPSAAATSAKASSARRT